MREMSRRGGLSHSAIPNVISGITNPGLDFCLGIARALDIPAETVLHKMELLPPYPTEEEAAPDAFIREVTDILKHLTIKERAIIYDIAQSHYRRSRTRQK